MDRFYVSVVKDDQAEKSYIRLRHGKSESTVEVCKNIFVDIGRDGEVLGIEFLFTDPGQVDIEAFKNSGIPEPDLEVLSNFLKQTDSQ